MNELIANDSVFLGIKGIQDVLVSNWIGPVFFVVIAAVAIVLVWQKQIRALAVFAVVAVIGGLLIFNAEALFGNKGSLTGAGKKVVDKVNTVDSVDYQGIL